jgi:hypothetical protein
LANVIVPSSVTSGNDIFLQPTSDFTVKVVEGKVTITDYTGSAKDVVIPPTLNGMPVTAIRGGAFAKKGLTSVNIPDSVNFIGSYAFSGNHLTSVNIPDSVTDIGTATFYNNQLTNVSIGSNVSLPEWNRNPIDGGDLPSFDNYFNEYYNSTGKFAGTYVLQAGGWTGTRSDGGGSLREERDHFITTELEGEVIINRYTGSAKDVVIPPFINELPVTAIGERAFYNSHLTSVNIPDGITSIGEHAFSWNQLKNVSIPDSVTVIGKFAFYINRLTVVNIPDSVTSIGIGAFLHNSLESVTIPSSVTSIGATAFASGTEYALDFVDDFGTYYSSTGSLAGTYVLRDGEWSRANTEAMEGDGGRPAGLRRLTG